MTWAIRRLAACAVFGSCFAMPCAALAESVAMWPDPFTLELAPVDTTRWTVRLRNTGSTPARVAVDARLVGLELTAPAPTGRRLPKPIRCELPADLRPGVDAVGTLVLEPGKAVAIDFDPRLVCFDAKAAAALAAAERIAVRYQLPSHAAPLTSEPVVVPAAAKPAVRVDAGSADPDATTMAASADVSIETAPRIDGPSASKLSIRVQVENTSDRTRTAFVRPGNIGFAVNGPSGAFTCPVKGTPPIRELESRLSPHRKTAIEVLLGPTCAGRPFDRPGLYVVRPMFSSTKPGWDQGQSLDGERFGTPSLIRLRTGRKPLLTSPPRLE